MMTMMIGEQENVIIHCATWRFDNNYRTWTVNFVKEFWL